MGTPSSVGQLLFGDTRRAILALLYGHAEEQFYLRDLVRRTETALGAAQRELKSLTDVGLISRVRRGNQVYYQANSANPIFPELKIILTKTAGLRDVVQQALQPVIDRVRVAFIYGSVAQATETATSDIDVMIIGDVGFSEVTSHLSAVESKLGREVNPTVYPPSEYAAKLKKRNHFLRSVLKQKKVFVVGDEHEVRRLGQERLA
ncbi:MAG: ArsR family transcriptional regulator [Acidobacteria bacterium]|nr:MAG: ArsR family transcriptional regulator [Acidobacteriota bacterium]